MTRKAGRMSGVVDDLRRRLPRQRRAADRFAVLVDAGPAATSDDRELVALAALARELAPSSPLPAPDPGFRADLRQRLLIAAAELPAQRRDGSYVQRAPLPSPRPKRLRDAVATVLAVSLVTGTGAAVASTRALPGDALYGLKRGLEQAQLALAFSDLAQGRELLEQADARLGEAERLAASDSAGSPATGARLGAALGAWEEATTAGAGELTLAYRETGDPEALQVLSRFVDDQQVRLRELLPLLEPSLRQQVRAALDTLSALGARSTALLAAGVADGDRQVLAGPGEATASRAVGDGWAASRLTGRTGAAAGGAPGSSGAPVSGAGSLTDAVGGVTGGSGGGAAGAGPGSSSGSLVDVLDPGAGGTTVPLPAVDPLPTADPLPTVVPLPTTSPLPTTGPLPSVTSNPLPSTSLPLPSASLSGCVPVPPLTTC